MEQMQRKTHSQTLDGAQVSHGRVEEKIEEPKEDRYSTGRPTESTHLDPQGLLEIESPTKGWALVGPRPLPICRRWATWSSCWFPNKPRPESIACLPACGPHSPKGTALYDLRGCTYSCIIPVCRRELVPRRGSPLSTEKVRVEWGRVCVRGYRVETDKVGLILR
jgi:hypothetical protein